jgi:hypothetical protein
MSRVWEHGPLRQAERFVLLAIADYANDDGECWPSIAGICRKTCMSERGVQTIIRRLEQSGWLHISIGGGRRNCNLYTIKTPHDVPPEPYAPPQMDAKTPHMDTETPQMNAVNPAPHAPEPSLTIINHQRTVIADDGFNDFWAVVPKKAGKGQAAKAWKAAIKKAHPDAIISAMSDYAKERKGKDAQYTAHPATWLNGERWLDESAPSQQDFHNLVSQALGENHGLQPARQIDNGQPQRIFEALQAPRAPGRTDGFDGTARDGRGNEPAYRIDIRPKRFGGAD